MTNNRELTHEIRTTQIHDIIKQYQPIDRDQIVKLTGIPRTSVFDIIIELMEMNLVKKFVTYNYKKGRPRVFHVSENYSEKITHGEYI